MVARERRRLQRWKQVLPAGNDGKSKMRRWRAFDTAGAAFKSILHDSTSGMGADLNSDLSSVPLVAGELGVMLDLTLSGGHDTVNVLAIDETNRIIVKHTFPGDSLLSNVHVIVEPDGA